MKKVSVFSTTLLLLITTFVATEKAAFAQDIPVIALATHDHHSCAISQEAKLYCWGKNNSGSTSVPTDLGKVRQVSVSGDSENDHTCALDEEGSVRCWGSNSSGQLNIPTNLGKVRQIELGGLQTCAITFESILRCWGRNSDGQVDVPSSLGKVLSVSAGQWHTCAITSSEELYCWGRNSNGQLDIPNNLGKVRQVSVGSEHTCVVTSDFEIRCWGLWFSSGPANLRTGAQTFVEVSSGPWNTCGLATNKTVTCWGSNSITLTQSFNAYSEVQVISSGLQHACGAVYGQLVCYGDNSRGQLRVSDGLGSLLGQSANASFEVQAINMPGTDNYYFVNTNSLSWEAARSQALQMTFRGSTGHLVNITSEAENNFVSSLISRSWLGARATNWPDFRWVDGPEAGQPISFKKWGQGEPNNWNSSEPWIETSSSGYWNDNGAWSSFPSVVEFEGFPPQIVSTSVVSGLASVGGTIKSSQVVFEEPVLSGSSVWQTSQDGSSWNNLGNPVAYTAANEDSILSITPDLQGRLIRYTTTAANESGVRESSSNVLGPITGESFLQTRSNTSTGGFDRLTFIKKSDSKSTTTSYSGVDEKLISVDGSWNHQCAVTIEGKVRCQGTLFTDYLMLGTSDASGYVSGIDQVVSIATGWPNTCVLRVDGFVWCWGSGYQGQTGQSYNYRSTTPKQVGGLERVIGLESLYDHTCAIEEDFTLKCWGSNSNGQIGAGNIGSVSWGPTTVLDNITSVGTGRNHTCATKSDLTVWCWGANDWGQLGSAVSSSNVPIQVPAIHNALDVFAGSDFSCVVTTENRVLCWGANNVGQISALQSTNSISSPLDVGLSSVASLNLGHGQSCAIFQNQKTSCWGSSQTSGYPTPSADSQVLDGLTASKPKVPPVAFTAGNQKITASWDTSAAFASGSVFVKLDGTSSSCEYLSENSCVFRNLENGKDYSALVRAAQGPITSSWERHDSQITPFSGILEIFTSAKNVFLDDTFTARVFGAKANGTLTVRAIWQERNIIDIDESGRIVLDLQVARYGKTTFYLTSGKMRTSFSVYSPTFSQIGSLIKVGKNLKLGVKSVYPGSLITVQVSDGRKFEKLAGNSTTTWFDVPGLVKGGFTYDILIDGRKLGSGGFGVRDK